MGGMPTESEASLMIPDSMWMNMNEVPWIFLAELGLSQPTGIDALRKVQRWGLNDSGGA